MNEPLEQPYADRFWAKVNKTGSCWIWTASRNSCGYGRFGLHRSSVLAHRIAYKLAVGEIPPGLTLDHLCRNRACVNPAHLDPVTIRENILRGEAPAALNARRTVCKRGHDFDQLNTHFRPNGKRDCLACRMIASRIPRIRDKDALCEYQRAYWHRNGDVIKARRRANRSIGEVAIATS